MAEYDWEELGRTLRKTCAKVALKVERAGATALGALERKSIEMKLAELYERLGRLLYKKLNGSEDSPELTERISRLMSQIEHVELVLEKKRSASESESN